MTRRLLYAVLGCLGLSFIYWRVHTVHSRETPHFELVEDRSTSHGHGCSSMLGVAEQVFEYDGVPGSTLTVLILGDQSTANEPWRMDSYTIPSIRKVLEGRAARLRQQQKIFRDISGKCQMLRRTTVSPIFLGVTQGVADLQARGCKASSRCQLFVDTDLEENVEPSMRKALGKNEGPSHISLPPIHNNGIAVVFCGVAVTEGRVHDRGENGSRRFVTRDFGRVKQMQEVWQSLFADPTNVRFEPYCPTPKNLEGDTLALTAPH